MRREPLIVKPTYRSTGVPHYDGNKLIEALPPIMTAEEFATLGTRVPPPSSTERATKPHIRTHCLDAIRGLVHPLPEYMIAEEHISRLIRMGYVNRRPGPAFFKKRAVIDQMPSQQELRQTAAGVLSLGMLVYGISGIGKTTMVDQILRGYPDAIDHTDILGPGTRWTQVVFLKVPVPPNGSIVGLCIDILKQLAWVLGDDSVVPVRRNVSVDEAVNLVGKAVNDYCIGLIVIDELQNLIKAPNPNRQMVLAFLTTLTETLGVPLVGVGTYAVQFLIDDAFRTARKMTSVGHVHVQRPMSGDETKWIETVDFLWDYCWVPNQPPLSKSIYRKLFDRSQGVTDVLVKLFIAWQYFAIQVNEDKMTLPLLDSVADVVLEPVAHALAILKAAGGNRLSKKDALAYDDVMPDDWMLDFDSVQNSIKARPKPQQCGSKRPGPTGVTPTESPQISSRILDALQEEDRYQFLVSNGFVVTDINEVA